jgi:flagellar assembly protein FliH
MTAVRKFMFEHDFDAETAEPAAARASADASAPAESEGESGSGADAAEPETPPAVYTEADLEAARAASYQAGYDAGVEAGQAQGRDAAETAASQAAQTALRQVAQGLAQLFNGLDDAEARRERQALELAMTVARRLFPALERRHGMTEVESVVTRTLERLRETPRVMVRAHPDTIAILEDQREALAAETGFEGKLKLVADSGMGTSDVNVTWSDGSAKRDTAAVWAAIDAAIRSAMDGADEAEIAAAQGRATPETAPQGDRDGASDGDGDGRAAPAPADADGADAMASARSADGGAAAVPDDDDDDGAAPAAAGWSA